MRMDAGGGVAGRTCTWAPPVGDTGAPAGAGAGAGDDDPGLLPKPAA